MLYSNEQKKKTVKKTELSFIIATKFYETSIV